MKTITNSIVDFISHCQFEKNLSTKTIKAYRIDLTQFGKYLKELKHDGLISMVSKNEIKSYLETISSLKPISIKRKIASLKVMFNFLEYEDSITLNPFRKMRIKIQEDRRLPKVMDFREINQIFNTVYKSNHQTIEADSFAYGESLRNVVVIELLFATGARVSEIANLLLTDIDFSSMSVKIKGKGNKERIIQICNQDTIRVLKKYERYFNTKIANSGGSFLINRLGTKLSDQSIRGMVRKICKMAKINRHITPHVFRHSLATLLLEKDVDIKYIQAILGHSSIMTTQIYTHVNRKKQRQILTLKHPRRDISTKEICYPE